MLKELVEKTVTENLKALGSESGAVFYSSPTTLQEGPFYIMGLNPGGKPEEHPISINESLIHAFARSHQKYSSYVDEFWGKGGTYSRHQKNVQALASVCGKDIRDIFSANFIFVRSSGTSGIKIRIKELAAACWPVHQLFLSIVRPRLILCLGNSDQLSSFSLLVDKVGLNRSAIRYVDAMCSNFQHGKYCEAEILLAENDHLKCTIVGVPHPSWHNPTPALAEFIKKIR